MEHIDKIISFFVGGVAAWVVLLIIFAIFFSACSKPERIEYDRETRLVRVYLPNDDILTGIVDWPLENEEEVVVTIEGKRYLVPACYVEEIGVVK